MFETQYNEFIKIKKLQIEIAELKRLKDVRIDQLPIEVFKKYEELCINYCVELNLACADSRDQIQEYLSTKK